MQTVDSGSDLRFVSLRYALRTSERVTYVSPPPVEFETEDARFRLADGNVTCDMKIHFPTQEAARAVVEPVLRAWEADADLRWKQGELRFMFDGAKIIDRSPASPGDILVHFIARVPAIHAIGGTVSVDVSRGHYPELPGTRRYS